MPMRIGIYGLGRFGSFWASLLSERHEVFGYNRTPLTEMPKGVARVSEEELFNCEAVFFCVAISSFEETVKRTSRFMRPETVMFDTCSVKEFPAAVMSARVPSGVSIIATHPMFGPDSGRKGVSGLPLVYWPIRAPEKTVLLWKEEFSALGLRIVSKSPEEHDREAAYTQGVTHYIGRILKDLDLKPSEIATRGYEKLLEIIQQTCNDPYQLFVDLQLFNPYTADMRCRLDRSVKKILSTLDSLEGKNSSSLTPPD